MGVGRVLQKFEDAAVVANLIERRSHPACFLPNLAAVGQTVCAKVWVAKILGMVGHRPLSSMELQCFDKRMSVHIMRSQVLECFMFLMPISTLSNSRGLVAIVVTEIEIHSAKLCPVSTRELNGG